MSKKLPKSRGVNNATSGVDEAAYSAAKLEEEEMRQDMEETVKNGIRLSDDDENTEYELPCGYTDKDGVKHTTYTIREMTGRDEEAVDRPDFKQNPAKAINVLLSRVVQSIGTLERRDFKPKEWDDIIKSLYTGDQDTILMQIRRNSVGTEITSTHRCPNPNCGAKLKVTVDIDELEVIPFRGETKTEFSLPRGFRDKNGEIHTEGTVRLATGLDREILAPVARKSLAKGNSLLLTRLCKFNDGMKVDTDTMTDLSVKDREYLTEIMNDMAFGYKLETEVTCDSCGEEFTARLSAVNFT